MKKLLSIITAGVIALQLAMGAATAVLATPLASAQVSRPSIPAGDSESNLLTYGSFDDETCLDYVFSLSSGQKLSIVEDENGGYAKFDPLLQNYPGFQYNLPTELSAGTYKVSAYFRTLYEGHVSWLRFICGDTIAHIYINNEWTHMEFYMTLNAPISNFRVCGGPWTDFIQPYCIDEFRIEMVDSIPEGAVTSENASFGTPVTNIQAKESSPELFPDPIMWDKEADSKYKVNGIMVNIDDNAMFTADPLKTEQAIKEYAYQFKDTQITDYVMCTGSHLSTAPSDVWMSAADKYLQKVDNGIAVDYTSHYYAKGAYEHFVTDGLNYFDILSKAFPEVGINFWLSLRMNDAHGLDEASSPITSDYYRKNPQLRRVQDSYPTELSWAKSYGKLFNYALPEVQQHFLEFINESLSRYDCYGFELEFMREPYLWSVGGEYNGLDIFTEFIRKVDELLKTYEAKWGHDIKLAVQVPGSIDACYDFGMDVVTCASEGLIDMVIPKGGHYSTTDNTMPIREWKSVMAPYGVQVCPDIENQVRCNPGATVSYQSVLTAYGSAGIFFSQGADKVHLYNNMPNFQYKIEEQDKIADYRIPYKASDKRGQWLLWTNIGSYEKLMTVDRKVLLSYSDFLVRLNNYASNAQLPSVITNGTTGTFKMAVGDIPAGAVVTLKFSANVIDRKAPPAVKVNGVACDFDSVDRDADSRTTMQLYQYTVPTAVHGDGYFVIDVNNAFSSDLRIDYMEVYIDVE